MLNRLAQIMYPTEVMHLLFDMDCCKKKPKTVEHTMVGPNGKKTYMHLQMILYN